MLGIIGIGFVGGAMLKSFEQKGFVLDKTLFCYDKFKDQYKNFESVLNADIIFLSLPTVFNETTCEYDKVPILEVCGRLEDSGFRGAVVIKSTVEPETTEELAKKFNLNLIHNPEFLTARTAYEDFHNQTHIILGRSSICSDNAYGKVVNFFSETYPDAEVSKCTSTESESMKIFVNSFYATKVQFFTEIHQLCQKNGTDYNLVKDLMLKNGWINPMHTTVPGPDGQISYGGMCFPKDTNALNSYMKRNRSPNEVLSSVIRERDEMRDDKTNII